jgi:glycylpeptide N-tetradecanoyltransferase
MYKFWTTQPFKNSNEIGPIESNTIVRKDPYPLPNGFYWDTIEIDQEVYDLLSKHYVEDSDHLFQFDYSISFLQWALKVPGYKKEWMLGVRQTNNKKLRAMITGVPVKTHIGNDVMPMAEINFLCIHKKIRSKRLTPVLIKEHARRVNQSHVWQAISTSGADIVPNPVSKCQYWHRLIHPKKLIQVGFSSLSPRMNMARTIRLYKVPTETTIPGFRTMQRTDIETVTKLYNAYQSKFKIWIEMSHDEVCHRMLPRDGIIHSYVVEEQTSGKVTDFCSFYHLPLQVLNHETHKVVDVAYLYYSVANTVPLKDLVYNALICASNLGYDVLNCLDIMDHDSFIKELKFQPGDGSLQYYVYNYAYPKINANQMGIVML